MKWAAATWPGPRWLVPLWLVTACASPMRYTSTAPESPGPLPPELRPLPRPEPPATGDGEAQTPPGEAPATTESGSSAPTDAPLPEHAPPTPEIAAAHVVTLSEVLKRAGDDGFEVLRAEARLAEAQARTQQVDGELGPVLDVRAGAGFFAGRTQGIFGVVDDANFWRFDPSIGLIYRVNLGGGIHRSRAARHDQDAQAIDVVEARRRAMLSAALAHHDLALSQVSIDVATQLVADAERFLEIAQARADAEVASGADVELARAELANARRVQVEAKGQWEASAVVLATLLRDDPTRSLAAARSDLQRRELVRLDDSKSLAQHASSDRPDLQAAQRRVDAARSREKAARLDVFVPDLAVEVRERFIGSGPSTIGPGTIAQGFFGWTFSLADLGRVRTAKRERETMEIDVRSLEAEAAGQVHAEAARARATRAAIEQAEQALVSTERHYQIQLARFEMGSALGLEVITAQNAVARARMELAAAVLRYNVQQLRVLGAMGRLDAAVDDAGS